MLGCSLPALATYRLLAREQEDGGGMDDAGAGIGEGFFFNQFIPRGGRPVEIAVSCELGVSQ